MSSMGVLAHGWVAVSPPSWDWRVSGVFLISTLLCDGLWFSVILIMAEVVAHLAGK